MYKVGILSAIFAASALTSVTASANDGHDKDGIYVTVGGTFLSDRNIPVEVAPFGVVDVDANVTLDVDNYYIGFARGILPVSDEFDLFVRLGYGEANGDADITATALGFSTEGSVSQSESGFAYGVGGQYDFTQKDGIRADYTRLDDTDIISLAYARRF